MEILLKGVKDDPSFNARRKPTILFQPYQLDEVAGGIEGDDLRNEKGE